MPIVEVASPTHRILVHGDRTPPFASLPILISLMLFAVNAGHADVSLDTASPGLGTRDILLLYSLAGRSAAVGSLFYEAAHDDGFGGPFRVQRDPRSDAVVGIAWDTRTPHHDIHIDIIRYH